MEPKTIIIHASEPLKIERSVDQHAPADRRYSYVLKGVMRSPTDTYHSFDELYDHRVALYISFAQSIYEHAATLKAEGRYVPEHMSVWRSKRHSDGELCFGTGTQFVMGISKQPGKMVTYHIPIERWNDTAFAETLEVAPEWDGHTSADVLERLKNL